MEFFTSKFLDKRAHIPEGTRELLSTLPASYRVHSLDFHHLDSLYFQSLNSDTLAAPGLVPLQFLMS